MARVSQRKHWDRFWSESKRRGDIYSTDSRVRRNLGGVVDPRGALILEVGAGTGRDGQELACEGATVCSLDYSEEALDLITSLESVRLLAVCGDALRLPFRDETFDVVFHQGLLEHFEKPLSILGENVRVLKPGGILLVDVPQKFHYYTLLKHALMIFKLWFAGWETEFTVKELRRLVESAGLEVMEVYGENLHPPVWYRGLRKVLLKFKVVLPMYPLDGPSARRLRSRLRNLVPITVRLNTSMVIGVIARKPFRKEAA